MGAGAAAATKALLSPDATDHADGLVIPVPRKSCSPCGRPRRTDGPHSPLHFVTNIPAATRKVTIAAPRTLGHFFTTASVCARRHPLARVVLRERASP